MNDLNVLMCRGAVSSKVIPGSRVIREGGWWLDCEILKEGGWDLCFGLGGLFTYERCAPW